MDSSGSQDKKSIPRFSSFKLPPSAPLSAPEADRLIDRRHEISRRSKHGRSDRRSRSPRRSEQDGRERSSDRYPRAKRRRRSHSRDRRRSRERQQSRDRRERPNDDAQIKEEARVLGGVNEHGAGEPDLFIIDRKGDRHNLTYGATHRYAVPAFRRAGGGRVIGINTSYRIDREHRDTDSIILRTREQGLTDGARAKSSRLMSKSSTNPTRLFRIRQDDTSNTALEHMQDFIQFDSATPSNLSDDDDSADERHAYRSIRGKAKDEDVIPGGLEAISDSKTLEQDIQIDIDAERKARNAELSRAIDSNPTDVAAWLRLIDHQDMLILGARDESRPFTYAERQSLAEVKQSLYEKALRKVGDSPHKDRLLLGRLYEGAKSWDARKLLAQWKDALKMNSPFISLWVKYLDFRQTDFYDFAFEQCMAVILECLSLNASSAASPYKTQVQCYLFLRLTLFLREAGYVELAVGLWQAVLEFTCFRPSSFAESNDREGALSSFAEFWESEVPRIGEVGATGWRNTASSDVDPVTHSYETEVNSADLLTSWTEAERERYLDCRLPSRSIDEFKSGINDPYTVVLFSDLQHILPFFWELNNLDELIDSFLYFCHLPHLTVPQNVPTTRLWSGDDFVRNEFVDNAQTDLSPWIASQEDNSQFSKSPFSFPVPNFIHSTNTMFAATEKWFSSFQAWATNTSSESSVINSGWVRRILRSLVELHEADNELAEYALAVEFVCDREAAKKFAKRLLKTRSSNLRLYNCFALMQSRTGAQSTADHVWSTALSMRKDFDDYDMIDSGLLWNSWAWEFLQCEDFARASHVLHATLSEKVDLSPFSEPVQFNATSMLRIQTLLRESQGKALAYRKPQVYASYTDCLALLLYIVEASFDASLDVYASAVLKLRDLPVQEESMKAFTAELVHQSRARLIYFHVQRKGKFKPVQIHNIFKESISLFPHNTLFLSLFMWNEARFPIFDRIRDIRDLTKSTDPDSRYRLDGIFGLQGIVSQSTPVSTHLFSIYSELCRPVFTGGTAHSARAAFEKAIGEHIALASMKLGDKNAHHTFDVDSARSNLTVWKLYILFELYKTRDINAAKAVLYRAIRACPWSKELVMLAFEHLRDDQVRDYPQPLSRKRSKNTGFSFDDLCQLYNVLIEKQLRIHLNIQSDILDVLAHRHGASEAAEDSP
ncbi:hypothetical protein PENDEC_c010G06885 [Penicillium decumbens]|uniref:DUF1740-domain-containing protein n=1 Tax=Penicillium decumbens TaxID=69771 RepID=A0A1V6PBZ8_PENDC|nr:hypothetical protein PENDEC_c010G06885 [Penicillium decumbens]